MKSVVKVFDLFLALALAMLMASCSDDKMAGGTTEDAGIIADLDVAGLAQKGPFVKGSVVTLQGVDCKTMEFTDEVFKGAVINDDGEYVVENVSLSVACALLEVTGYYLNESTGKKSTGEITLHTLTDLSGRESVNINVFTELEYKRVMKLVTEKKKSFADAKKQAEKEVLAAFDVKGDFVPFEDLDIFENGKDDVALLDVSIMLQADLDATELAERLENIAADIAKDGKWDDRSSVIPASSSSTEGRESNSSIKDTYLNPGIAYGEMTDSRDGQVYKTIKIGKQVWMAQNLNYEAATGYCYNDSAEYCEKYGRLYTWAASVDKSEKECGLGNECNLASGNIRGICPDGWYLPSEDDFETLIKAVGGEKGASAKLKSLSGWRDDDGESGNGTDAFGFSALPVGVGMQGYYGEGYGTQFWGSTECGPGNAADKGYSCASIMSLEYDDVDVDLRSYAAKDFKFSVRCIKEDGEFVPVSSSSVIPASSGNLPSSSSSTEGRGSSDSLVNAYLNPDVEYVEMTDPRDGRVYKVAYIDRRYWMAENLDYADSVNMPSLKGRSWCYQNKPENCATMGRLYSWAAAIDSSKLAADGEDCGAGKTCGLRGPVQGVCPDGWHLPTKVEWVDMWEAIAGNEAWNVAGSLLKSKTGWNNDANGSDDYGFSAAPAGFKAGAAYGYFGEYARFWSSTENEEAENGTASSNRNAYNVIYGLKDDPQLSGDDKAYGMSVRCVANDGRLDWTVPKESYLNPDIDYGELTDSRDGQVYKTVKIGNQTWMAQNLNYADSVKTPSLKGNSWCFGDKPKRCNVGGRLYTWAAAIDSVGLAKDPDNPRDCGKNKECPFTESVHGICPDGWHLPSKAEFDTLVATVGGKEIAELNLRSRIGWSLYETGSDSYGFSAIPVGRRLNDKESGNVEYLFSGLAVDFWSSSECYTGTEPSPTMMVYVLRVYDDQNSSPVVIVGKGAGYSVRCLKD